MLPALPDAPVEPARPAFPVVAVAAPLVGAVVIGLVTGSPFVLVFALLSPIIAVGSVLDARRTARRTRRRDEARFDRDCTRFAELVIVAHRDEADERLREALAAQEADSGPVLVGVAPGASRCQMTDSSPEGDVPAAVQERRAALSRHSAVNPALPVTVPRGPVCVRGESATARGLRRALAAMPGVTLLEDDAERGTQGDDVVEIAVEGLRVARVRAPGVPERRVRLVLASDRERAARSAERDALVFPDRVAWSRLQGAASLGAAVGVDARGAVVGVDLLGDGPHVLVGGTTGSGKSEFLRVLALSIAARHSPAQWSLLLVDFKGGSTFADLERLPHCAGVITDLDDALADRALGSLRAEITRRERLLLAQGARDLRNCADPFPRLLVLVDEYAALVQTFPELQQVFADLSARGRSLGIHLVLCTQRPHGVVRDAVVANCAIRVVFRTTEAADARAVLGTDAPDARALPPGRALLLAGGAPSTIQVALLKDGDVEAVLEAASVHPTVPTPWAPVLPALLTLDAVHDLSAHEEAESEGRAGMPAVDARGGGEVGGRGAGGGNGVTFAFGALDDVDAQRWRAATWRPRSDGHLAVLGAPGAGRTTALATCAAVARAQGWSVIHVPASLADAVEVLDRIAADPPPHTLMVVDDLDHVLAAAPAAHGSLLLDRWDRAAAELRRSGGAAAAVLGTATAAHRIISGRFGARLVLRSLDEDDHALSGAPRRGHDRRAPAGRGWWFEHRVQVALPPRPLPAPARPALPVVPLGSESLAILSADPARTVAHLRRLAPERTTVTALDTARYEHPTSAVALDHPLFVGDADDWQRAWPLWSTVRRHLGIVVEGVSEAEVRALLGSRASMPPLDQSRGEIGYRPAGTPSAAVRRARWPDATSADAAPA